MIYLLQVILYTALMYGVYVLVLKNRVQHQLSRAFLLASALLPAIIPLIRLPIFHHAVAADNIVYTIALPVVYVANRAVHAEQEMSLFAILAIVYALVSLILIIRFAMQYYKMMRFIKSREAELFGTVKLIRNTEYEPGSWGRYIFVPGAEMNEAILKHEMAHIELKHSRDVVFMQILKYVFWPNLFLYVIEKELRVVHEFQADQYAVDNIDSYTETLLNNAFTTTQFSLSHTFFYNPLKRRIIMLQKSLLTAKASTGLKIRLVGISIMLFTGILYLQGCDKKFDRQKTTTPINTSMISSSDSIYSIVDKMPEPDIDINQFLAYHLIYPETAKQNKIEGKVYVRFVINKDGKLIKPELLRSPDPALGQAAMNAITEFAIMSKWTPGENKGVKVPVYFVMPIVFSLRNDVSGKSVKNDLAIRSGVLATPPSSEKADSLLRHGGIKVIMDPRSGQTNAQQDVTNKTFPEMNASHVRAKAASVLGNVDPKSGWVLDTKPEPTTTGSNGIGEQLKNAKTEYGQIREKQLSMLADVYDKGITFKKIGNTSSASMPPDNYMERHKSPRAPYDLDVYFKENIVYPDAARKNNITGKVVVMFTVDVNGNIVHPKILRSPDESLNKSALDLISKMPKWVPAEMDGKKQEEGMIMPIAFQP